MMTNSEFFKAAHATARETRASFATYRMAFSAALKGLYAMEKKANEKTTAEKLEALGIDAWERGEMKRYYINSDKLEAVFGLEVSYYKTGNLCWARLNGEGISNAKAAKLIGRAIFFDAASEKWMQNREGRTVELNETLMSSIRI